MTDKQNTDMTDKQMELKDIFIERINRLIEGKWKTSDVMYSHTKQSTMRKLTYMWKHLPSGKVGKTNVWASSVSALFDLCYYWNNKMPSEWKYIPLDFK